jgi:hypothetical protein
VSHSRILCLSSIPCHCPAECVPERPLQRMCRQTTECSHRTEETASLTYSCGTCAADASANCAMLQFVTAAGQSRQRGADACGPSLLRLQLPRRRKLGVESGRVRATSPHTRMAGRSRVRRSTSLLLHRTGRVACCSAGSAAAGRGSADGRLPPSNAPEPRPAAVGRPAQARLRPFWARLLGDRQEERKDGQEQGQAGERQRSRRQRGRGCCGCWPRSWRGSARRAFGCAARCLVWLRRRAAQSGQAGTARATADRQGGADAGRTRTQRRRSALSAYTSMHGTFEKLPPHVRPPARTRRRPTVVSLVHPGRTVDEPFAARTRLQPDEHGKWDQRRRNAECVRALGRHSPKPVVHCGANCASSNGWRGIHDSPMASILEFVEATLSPLLPRRCC